MGSPAETSSRGSEAEGSLSLAQLSARSGATGAFIEHLAALGIISRQGDGGFTGEDIQRVRLALSLEGSGISLEDFGKGVAAGKLSLEFAGHLLDEPRGVLDTTQRGLLAEVGLSPEWSDWLAVMIGLPPDPGEQPLHEDEAELIRSVAELVSSGFSEERTARALQVMGDAMRQITAVENEMWREDMVRPALEAGMTHQEMLDRTTVVGPKSERLAQRLIPLLHRRYMDELIFRNTVEWLESAMEEAGVGRGRTSGAQAIAFLDLSGFTHLTEEQGDVRAAQDALRLFDIVRSGANSCGGKPVKFLGDGVMLHFPEPPRAVRCALDLVDQAEAIGLPPARAGISAGPLIVREADYFGATVNVAARIADYARPREVLVAESAASVCAERDLAFKELGPTPLKGVAEPVRLYQASRAG